MFENPRRGRQARNFTTNVPKVLDLKSFSEQIFFRKLSLGAPDISLQNFHCLLLEFFLSVHCYRTCVKLNSVHVSHKNTKKVQQANASAIRVLC